MNNKIVNELAVMFQASPQLMRDNKLLRYAIKGTFGVEINDLLFTDIVNLAEEIDHAVLKNYFSTVWQPQTTKLIT